MAERFQETYMHILMDTLKKKLGVLNEIYKITKKQEELLLVSDFDESEFEKTIEKKGIRIRELERCDQGFETVYSHVREELKSSPGRYREEGQRLQQLIRCCTDLGVAIEALEQQNRLRFEQGILSKRQEIKRFHVKNQAASTYYRHMANQHQEGNSYFLDKKK